MFTSVGMKSFSLLIDQKNNYTVEMEENQQGLGEVIVVGYTSQRKQDLTGAIAVVDMAPVKNNSSGKRHAGAAGRVAGLYIEKDGSPNGTNSRILIRGSIRWEI